MPVRIDETAWPMVIVHFDGTPTDEEFAGYLRHFDGVLARQEAYAVIFDASVSSMAPFAQRRQQADWLKRNHDGIKRYCRGAAFVLPSMAMRAVLSTIFLLAPLPVPRQICATLDEAMAWTHRRLKALGQ